MSFDSQNEATIGVRIVLPFYNGGFNYSRVREAQALVESNEADIVSSMRDTAQRVGSAWSDLKVADATIEAGQLEVQAAQIAFEGVREEAKVGARTTLDVLDAEQELLSARGRSDRLAARRICRGLRPAVRDRQTERRASGARGPRRYTGRGLLRIGRGPQFRLGSHRRYRLDTFLPPMTNSRGGQKTRPGRMVARGDFP